MFLKRIIIFANGELPNLEKARALLRDDDFIIAADGGTRHALALGLTPNIIIGDLDSATFDLRPLTEKGTQIIRHPADKNETDLELAIQRALELNPTSIVIAAALGGRIDQTLANISLLTDNALSQKDVRLDDGVEEVFFCRNAAQVKGNIGDTVSLIPWNGSVGGVSAAGLKWTLKDETLFSHKSRGVSNEMTAEIATVKIQLGLLLVVHRRNS